MPEPTEAPRPPRPVLVENPNGTRSLVDANRLPSVTVAMRACRPWEFGDERHGRRAVECSTPGCDRMLAVSPDPGRREARIDAGTLYICGHARAGYCSAMFGRPAPGQEAA